MADFYAISGLAALSGVGPHFSKFLDPPQLIKLI
jgi:hypothetical protein